MSQSGVLNRSYTREFGENTKPAIYYLGPKSKYFLKDKRSVDITLLNRIYKEKRRSPAFRDRCMFIFYVYLSLVRSAGENNSRLYFYTKTELEPYSYLPDPVPDAYIVVEQGKDTARYFLEVVNDQSPRFILRNRVESLIEYYDMGQWQENTNHPFPRILMVCPNHVIKGFLSKFISRTLEMDGSDISFYLTTKDQAEATSMKVDIWQKVEIGQDF